jgi:peroxiredoxin
VRFANSPEFVEFATNLEESVIGAVGANGAETADENESSSSSLIITNPQTTQDSPAESTQESTSAIASIAELAADIPSTGISLGNYAPPFETTSDTGVPVRLADLRGQVVLLNFWATWCGPCRVEMPEFESLYNQHKDEGFTVLAINNAETAAQIQSFRQELGLNFPMLLDETGEIQRLYNIDGYPRTFLLDRNGIIIARQWGPLTVEQIQELVTSALKS